MLYGVPIPKPRQQQELRGLREGRPGCPSWTQPDPTSHRRVRLRPWPWWGHLSDCVCKEGQKHCTEGIEEKTDETNVVNTKVRIEGGGGAAPGPGAEIPLRPLEEPAVTQVVSLQPIEGTTKSRWMCSEGSCSHVSQSA